MGTGRVSAPRAGKERFGVVKKTRPHTAELVDEAPLPLATASDVLDYSVRETTRTRRRGTAADGPSACTTVTRGKRRRQPFERRMSTAVTPGPGVERPKKLSVAPPPEGRVGHPDIENACLGPGLQELEEETQLSLTAAHPRRATPPGSASAEPTPSIGAWSTPSSAPKAVLAAGLWATRRRCLQGRGERDFRSTIRIGTDRRVETAQRADERSPSSLRARARLITSASLLGLDDDHSEFHAVSQTTASARRDFRRIRGLRPLRTGTVAQSLLRAVAGQLIQQSVRGRSSARSSSGDARARRPARPHDL